MINMAMSLDGKVARPDGKWYGLSSKEDRIQMDIYRSEVEVLILGKNSIQNDDPNVHIRYLKNCKSPRPVLLIRKGILSKEKKIFQFAEENLVPILILIFLYMLHTTGELFLSPIGLSILYRRNANPRSNISTRRILYLTLLF